MTESIEGEQGRIDPPTNGTEAETLLGFLDFQRATFAWKTSGLDADGLATRVASSTMTLGGMMKHLAYVELHWFSSFLWLHPAQPPWDGVDWDADRDWEWNSAAEDSPAELRALWDRAVSDARELTSAALADDGLGQLSRRQWPNGEHASLRWILVHMIEEYARHNGHADLIRESIDGRTGE